MNKNLPLLKIMLGTILSMFLSLHLFSQTYVPVAINGFNQDVVAETGTSSLTTTTISLDGFTISNKVIYTNTFRTTNGFGGGGIPDNGIISDATTTYQLADYGSNNALLVQRNQNGDLNITTPAAYDHLRVLCFSTEGISLLNITLFFSDGTSTAALTNYSLGDWFDNTTNLVLAGIGRCTRATPATGADAYPNNPRMYYIDIPVSCADRQKNLSRINFANITTAGTNAPYPNSVFFAVSASSYNQQITDGITDATCTTAGSVMLTITGSSPSYNVTWNTTPSQTGLTASNLQPGNYIATITDANSCITMHQVTIGQTNNASISAHADTSICFGASFNANINSNATVFQWTPTAGVSDPSIVNPVLSPADTTSYTVTGTLGTCPPVSTSFIVNVIPQITLNIPGAATVCPGNSFTPTLTSNATTFQWSPTQGVSNPAILNPILSPSATTTYTIIASSGVCSLPGTFTVTVPPAVNVSAGSSVTIAAGQTTILQGSGDAGTYLWSPSTGLSATNILMPIASPIVTTTYTLMITTADGCSNSASVLVNVVPECAKPMNAITPNGDGINDKWIVTQGNCGIAKVTVFNRYGHRVYESQNYGNDWQGTYNGKSLPDGTYYYVIQYTINGNYFPATLRGDITILR